MMYLYMFVLCLYKHYLFDKWSYYSNIREEEIFDTVRFICLCIHTFTFFFVHCGLVQRVNRVNASKVAHIVIIRLIMIALSFHDYFVGFYITVNCSGCRQ